MHIAVVVLVAGVWYAIGIQAQTEMSERLGIGTSLLDFNTYIYDNFKPGLTRRQVIELANRIGVFKTQPLYIGDEYCEIFFFQIGPFQKPVGSHPTVCYDDSGKIISVTSADFQ